MMRRPLVDLSASALAGMLVAALLLVGRWSPTRLTGGEPNELLMPRTWLVGTLALVALFMRPRRWRLPGPSPYAVAPTVVLFGWLLCAWTWSPVPADALPKAYDIVLMLVLVTSMFRILRGGDPEVFQRSLWDTVVVLAGALGAIALSSLSDGTGRLAILGGGPNVFGRNMGVLALIALDRALRGGNLRVWTPIAALSMLLVVLSGSRGAMIATATGGLVLSAACRLRWKTLIGATLLLAAVGLGVVMWTEVGQRALEFFERRIILLVVKERYLAGRDVLYTNALDLLRNAPWMGGGLASFRVLGLGVYPHNLFLEVACDGGSIGLGLLVALLVAAAYRAHLARWSNPPALAVATLYLIASQVSGDLYDTRALFVTVLLVGLRAASVTRPDPGRRGRNRVIVGPRTA